MKYLLFFMLATGAYAQNSPSTSAQFDLNAAVFQNDHIGVLSFDVLVDQNLQDFDDRDLERVKISVLNAAFGDGNVKLETEFLSVKRDSYRITPEEKYAVNQMQLISGRITSVTPMKKGFKLTITAHAGIGFSVKGYLNSANNEMVTKAEYKIFQAAKDCTECLKEAVKQVGYFPIEAGLKVQLNKDRTYISVSGDYQKSGKLNTIPGEDRLPILTDRYKLHVSEDKTVIPLGVEVGHEIKNSPVSIYARGERISYRSSVDSSTQGYRYQFDDRTTNNYTMKVGLRVKFGGVFR